MALDSLGKAILNELMSPPSSINTIRMQVQFATRCTGQEFWQRMESLISMGFVKPPKGFDGYVITPKGRAFYLADGVVDTESTP